MLALFDIVLRSPANQAGKVPANGNLAELGTPERPHGSAKGAIGACFFAIAGQPLGGSPRKGCNDAKGEIKGAPVAADNPAGSASEEPMEKNAAALA